MTNGLQFGHVGRQTPRGPVYGASSMPVATRVLAVSVGVAVAAALIAYYVIGYLTVTPPVVAATGSAPNVNITLQTVASYGHSPHTDWVSYLAKNPDGKWVHSTVFRVPAHSVVRVTVLQYDTATGL